jgi:hypothetical protein
MGGRIAALAAAGLFAVAQIAAGQAPERGGSPDVERGDRRARRGERGARRGESVDPGAASTGSAVSDVGRRDRSRSLTTRESSLFGEVTVVGSRTSRAVLLSPLFERNQVSTFPSSPLAAADLPEAIWTVGVYKPRGLGSWLRLQVEPRYALVYVDGFYAGLVENFDGPFRRLRLPLGRHLVEVRAPGHEPLVLDVWQQHDVWGTYRATLTPRP